MLRKSRACVYSVYQALLLLLKGPGYEASFDTDESVKLLLELYTSVLEKKPPLSKKRGQKWLANDTKTKHF